MDITTLSVPLLLQPHGAILDELRRRKIVRSNNNPASELAELLFCRAFAWLREPNSASGHDACDGRGTRYQIKCRRLTNTNKSRQLSAIRNLPARPFDQLAGVLFSHNYEVLRAALIPLAVVVARAKRSEHTNSWRFQLRDDVWCISGVVDVTVQLKEAELLLE
jgi:hypothetical protein